METTGLLPSATDPLKLRLHRYALKHRPWRRLTKALWPSVTTTIRGAQFEIRPHDNGSETHAWWNGDLREPRSTEVLAEIVGRQNSFVIDIGANCGFFSVFFAKYATAASRIHCFEPNPEMVKRLKRNLTLNSLLDRVQIHEVALSDGSASEATLYVEQSRGESSLETSNTAVKTISVKLETLADVVAQAQADETIVIKIDIEGHEPSVLGPFFSGQPERKPDYLLLEVVHQGKWSTDLLKVLEEAGYKSIFDGEDNSIFKLQA